MIVIAGMIGVGKTTVANLLAKALNGKVIHEEVDNNPILPLFYNATEEETDKYRYPFLLQLYFLNTRYESIKKTCDIKLNIIDRSIYEDWYFAKINKELGRINEMEFMIYERYYKSIVDDMHNLYNRKPILMIYLRSSFHTIMKNIKTRGRIYEQAPSLIKYYKILWEGYDDWVINHYHASDVLTINMDCLDVVNNEKDCIQLINLVSKKFLAKVKIISNKKFDNDKNKEYNKTTLPHPIGGG